MAGSVDIPQLRGWQDSFENQISARTNVLDLAAHYPYSPERWRIFVDGTRAQPEYGSIAQYSHAGDYHELSPAAGETVTFRSAERPRYVVQYELAATFAFAVNQSLATGDSIKVGLYDGTDGWYMKHDGSHSDTEADFVLERDGTEVYRRTGRDISAPVTRNARLKLQTGWYDITRQKWERSYSRSGTQENDLILSTSNDSGRGSKTGNLPIYYEVTASGSTTDLTLEVGSCAQVNLGTTTPLTRVKSAEFRDVTIDTAGTWVPLTAIRVDPDRRIINTQLRDLIVHEYTASDDVHIMAMAHAPGNVLDGGGAELTDTDFSTPVEHSETNSVIEESSAVEQAPDSTGTPVTDATNPGGYQLGHASLHTSGQGSTLSQSRSGVQVKRAVHNGDIIVFWGNSDTTGDVTFEYTTEQDW